MAVPRNFTELELQARWFAGDFGRSFTGTAGEEIEIVQFGTWNREAGPDFSDAAIRIDGGEFAGGSIEFDLTDQNWEVHGHATNPAFDGTVLHVFVASGARAFFSRTTANRNVPQVRVDPATLPSAFSTNLPLARLGRCHAPLRGLPEEKIDSILAAAAQFRLQRKTLRLQRLSELHGDRRSALPRDWPERLATNRTSSLSLFSRSGFRAKFCAPGLTKSKPFSLASADFSIRRIWRGSSPAPASICASFGINGGRVAPPSSGSFSRGVPGA